jgi:hypothetical protein
MPRYPAERRAFDMLGFSADDEIDRTNYHRRELSTQTQTRKFKITKLRFNVLIHFGS